MEAKARYKQNAQRWAISSLHTRLWLRDSGSVLSAFSCKRRPACKATRKCHTEYQSGGNRSGRIFPLAMGVDRRRGVRHSWHRLSPPPSARHWPPDRHSGASGRIVARAYRRRCNHRRAVRSLEAQPKYSTRLTVKTSHPKPWKL